MIIASEVKISKHLKRCRMLDPRFVKPLIDVDIHSPVAHLNQVYSIPTCLAREN